MHITSTLGNEELNVILSTSSRSNPRSSSQTEKSIDDDEIDLDFPNDTSNLTMKKYTDDIWRKTLSSDCEPSIQAWDKQLNFNETCSMKPFSSSNAVGISNNYLQRSLSNEFCGNDVDLWSGGNIFFPTIRQSSSVHKNTSIDSKYLKTIPSTKSSLEPSTVLADDFNDDYNCMKKRLSLSSLRTSLCRQKAVENLNNGNFIGASRSKANEDANIVQVIFLFHILKLLFLFFKLICVALLFILNVFISTGSFQFEFQLCSRTLIRPERSKTCHEKQVRFVTKKRHF